jgi:hypothetical protein
MAACDKRACPLFDVARYFRDLRQHLPLVKPIATRQLEVLHAARDYKGMVRLIKRAMNVETDIRVVWVSEGEAGDASFRNSPAWIKLLKEMPPYGSEAFRQLRIDIFLRKSFLDQSQFDEISMCIAHELSHLVLESIGHPLRECEKAVDLTAMMLGFHKLFVTGTHKEMRLNNRIEIRELGYLTLEEVREAARIIERDLTLPLSARTRATLVWLQELLSKSKIRAIGDILLSNWRLHAVAFLGAPLIAIACWLVWTRDWKRSPQADQYISKTAALINSTQQSTDSALVRTTQPPQAEPTKESGERTLRVQNRLSQLGYLVAKPDGRWGPKSQVALRRLKSANGLIENDLLDPATMSALFASGAIPSPISSSNSRR